MCRFSKPCTSEPIYIYESLRKSYYPVVVAALLIAVSCWYIFFIYIKDGFEPNRGICIVNGKFMRFPNRISNEKIRRNYKFSFEEHQLYQQPTLAKYINALSLSGSGLCLWGLIRFRNCLGIPIQFNRLYFGWFSTPVGRRANIWTLTYWLELKSVIVFGNCGMN